MGEKLCHSIPQKKGIQIVESWKGFECYEFRKISVEVIIVTGTALQV